MDGPFNGARRGQKYRALAPILALLGGITAAAWAALWFASHRYAILLPLGVTAFVLGLRHAVDPDHIAAIDGTIRKLSFERKPARAVGLYFSLGHSTIVVVLSLLIAIFGAAVKAHFPQLATLGAIVGTGVSALFLVAIAAANCFILQGIVRRTSDEDAFPAGGLFSRILRPLLSGVKSAPAMYPVGLLFGLGFDTATEVALLGMSAISAAGGMPIADILILPWLFTAGMSLVDTLQGLAMNGAYGWASVQPSRKLAYNVNMTLLTIGIALFVAVAEGSNILGFHLAVSQSALGLGIICVFGVNVAATAAYLKLRPQKDGNVALGTD